MAQRRFETIDPGRRRRLGKVTLGIALVILLFGASSVAGYVIEYQWGHEMGQVETCLDMLGYGLAPVVAASPRASSVRSSAPSPPHASANTSARSAATSAN